ncbi:formimidoylglutamate deiminase, partial [Burkholderia sp. SIMBA_024]
VFYAHSGFGGQAPIDGQKRFIHSLDSYSKLMQGAQGVVDKLPGAALGIAPHSLRAVTGDELAAIEPLAKGGPIHIHVAAPPPDDRDPL